MVENVISFIDSQPMPVNTYALCIEINTWFQDRLIDRLIWTKILVTGALNFIKECLYIDFLSSFPP